jgi:hypothetical protein
LLLIGGLLLLGGGLWYWQQNAARQSYLNELERKVASLPFSGPVSTSPLSPTDSEVAVKQAPSATETIASDTQSAADQQVLDLMREISSSPPRKGTVQSLGREFTIATQALDPEKVVDPESVNRAQVERTQASSVLTTPSVTTAVGAVTAPENSTITRPPTDHAAIPRQPAAMLTVRSREEIFNFTPVAASTLAPTGSLPPANKIRIPAIDLVSVVEPLTILNHRGYLFFSIPKEFVGWIPNTGNPSERSRGWYMGHNTDVFKRLPEVVDLLAEGKTVDIILETEKVAYLYRVIGRPVIVTASEFNGGYFHTNLFAPEPEIVLTTCVPPRSFEYRLLVTARLAGHGVAQVTE